MPGTIRGSDDFDVEEACQKLMKAMKGFGTDEGMIIDVLAELNNHQRQEVKAYYQTAYGDELTKELKSELGGKFEDVILGMMMTPLEWDIHWLHRAVKGLGTDEKTLIDVLIGRDFCELDEIKAGYKNEHDDELDEVIENELSGDFCRLIRGSIAGGGEAAAGVDEGRAQEDAQTMIQYLMRKSGEQELLDAGIGSGTDELTFISILNTRSFPQLRATFEAFSNLAGNSIEESIDSEFSGNIKDGLLAIVKKINDTPGYFAERLHESMSGVGTRDNALMRIILARSEIDLEDIKSRYAEIYEKSLSEDVESETGGDYKQVLLRILGN